MQVNNQPDTEDYVPPAVTEMGAFDDITEGQYSKKISDDSDAGGYWDQ